LTLDATASGEEGIFAVGTGPKEARLPNGYKFACTLGGPCGNFAEYALDLYTNTAATSATIGIDANQVNYSGMPTCNMLNFTQQDLGIYEILWASDGTKPLSVAKMSPSPFTTTVPTVAKYYAGSGQWVVGVSQTIIEPGQYEYVALCSSTPSTTPAMQLLFFRRRPRERRSYVRWLWPASEYSCKRYLRCGQQGVHPPMKTVARDTVPDRHPE
jgi:hypothetical protein